MPRPPSSASTALYRGVPRATSGYTDGVSAGIPANAKHTAPPAPAWPPCRAARQAHTPIKTKPDQQALFG
jgi:hypothetical protein